ncbi:acyl-CoA dehydrogenase [Nocardioides phosphati]|uniref:Acyl-CoA dehydrogenase n=1 Tax=Nocardioides phosphati TaxID=1867775 RepID=A0ABQ2N7K2_9ACTN|nr:acyl-CoA dehydrogenase family protein [Nocardioides phosphati]GGO86182.1 acyl-CoA dehydrogenase [Nocardioides phosphati]
MDSARQLGAVDEEAHCPGLRELLATACAPSSVARLGAGDRSAVSSLWAGLAGLGLPSLLVPERLGGAGASAREAAAVLEELGRHLAPVPFLASAVVATRILLDAGHGLVGDLATGARRAALVVPWATAAEDAAAACLVSVGADGRLRGRVPGVAGSWDADILIVPVAGAEGVALHLVAATDAALVPRVTPDPSRLLADVHFAGVPAEPVMADAGATLRRALHMDAALRAAEQVGMATRCLDLAVEHLDSTLRDGSAGEEFGSVLRRLDDLHVEIESGRVLAAFAAAVVEAGERADLSVAVAGAHCGALVRRAAEEVQRSCRGADRGVDELARLLLGRAEADVGAAGARVLDGAARVRVAARALTAIGPPRAVHGLGIPG